MYKLLIVDDEITIRTSLANFIPWNQEGFEVAGVCADGKDAIDFINANKIDALLIDIMMPRVSGIEVAKYIYENKLNIKTVLLSAHGEFDYARSGMRYGVRYYILKPTKYEELKQVFSEVRMELDKDMVEDLETNDEFLTIIERIKNYIDENYEDASLETVSELFHLNLHYISRLFKKKTNMNFSDYLNQVRMEKAKLMLNNSEIYISEICSRVGYSDPRSFSKAFKKHFGISPREYKLTITTNIIPKK
jgi:YesN/AraC family two-component response regulator